MPKNPNPLPILCFYLALGVKRDTSTTDTQLSYTHYSCPSPTLVSTSYTPTPPIYLPYTPHTFPRTSCTLTTRVCMCIHTYVYIRTCDVIHGPEGLGFSNHNCRFSLISRERGTECEGVLFWTTTNPRSWNLTLYQKIELGCEWSTP